MRRNLSGIMEWQKGICSILVIPLPVVIIFPDTVQFPCTTAAKIPPPVVVFHALGTREPPEAIFRLRNWGIFTTWM